MKYITDWPRRRERLCALWEREIIDRCCVFVTAADWNKFEAPTMAEKWEDGPQKLAYFQRRMEQTYYGGDAFPCYSSNTAVCGHAGFFAGAKMHYTQETVWYDPILENLDDLAVDPADTFYNEAISGIKYIAEQAGGDFIIAQPDFTGNADALAHLRGSEQLLCDMAEEPEAVIRALALMQTQYARVMREVYDIVKENNGGGGSVGWMSTYAPGFHAQMQCDLSVMISARDFERYIMPELHDQTELLEYPVYHFDGIEQLRHLDMLLSLDKLKMIQWTSVVGQPPAYENMDALKRIQKAGKCLHLSTKAEDVPMYLEALSSKGLYLRVNVNTPEEADALVDTVARGTHE